jgi:hypothetical protein
MSLRLKISSSPGMTDSSSASMAATPGPFEHLEQPCLDLDPGVFHAGLGVELLAEQPGHHLDGMIPPDPPRRRRPTNEPDRCSTRWSAAPHRHSAAAVAAAVVVFPNPTLAGEEQDPH